MPLVGTWIETLLYLYPEIPKYVVPLVGTWIETFAVYKFCVYLSCVVPLVGTWIETLTPHLGILP